VKEGKGGRSQDGEKAWSSKNHQYSLIAPIPFTTTASLLACVSDPDSGQKSLLRAEGLCGGFGIRELQSLILKNIYKKFQLHIFFSIFFLIKTLDPDPDSDW
jgi:hypothetical protein